MWADAGAVLAIRNVVSGLLAVSTSAMTIGGAIAQGDSMVSIAQSSAPPAAASSAGSPIDLPPISLAPPTAANIPVDEGLRQIEDSTHRMVWALAGIVHEARRTEVDVTPNPMFVGGIGCPYPFGYDPEMLDPLESYGFDFGLDTAPTLRRDSGQPLPMRKEVVEPLVFQINDDANRVWTGAEAIKLPDGLGGDAKAQWQALSDTLRRMQQQVQWLQDVCKNNLDDNTLIAQSAMHIRDDAAGIDEIAKRLLKTLPH